MAAEGPLVSALSLLLISADQAWHDATNAALTALGGGRMDVTADPADALGRAMRANTLYTHILFDGTPFDKTAAAWIELFASLTIGDADSTTGLVRLGPDHGEHGEAPLVPYPDPTLLANALAASVTTSHLRPLTRADILDALRDGHIGCRFQPIVHMADRRPVGLEVLARLHHPVRGTLPPSLFIPQMEQAGLSLQLTDAVFQRCLSSIDAGFLAAQGLFLSINLPLDALMLPEALSRIDARRAAAGIPAAGMLIELTESVPVHDLPALGLALDRWRAIGYRLAIDDLGPDVVNQAMLVDMPFHVVKLDKQIVLRSRTDALARRYLQRTVATARSRSLSIIAEGIEDQTMWDRLAEMGVDLAQGFMIARPLPAAALPVWLDLWRHDAQQPPGLTA